MNLALIFVISIVLALALIFALHVFFNLPEERRKKKKMEIALAYYSLLKAELDNDYESGKISRAEYIAAREGLRTDAEFLASKKGEDLIL